MDDLLQKVLQVLGKSEEDFNADVEAEKEKLLANQNAESLADAVAFLIVNVNALAETNTVLMQQLADVQAKQNTEGTTNA